MYSGIGGLHTSTKKLAVREGAYDSNQPFENDDSNALAEDFKTDPEGLMQHFREKKERLIQKTWEATGNSASSEDMGKTGDKHNVRFLELEEQKQKIIKILSTEECYASYQLGCSNNPLYSDPSSDLPGDDFGE